MNTQTRLHHRRGIALMLVMIAILVVGGMATAYFSARDNSLAISTNVSSASRARIAAESGLDLAIAILETNADWRTNHIDGVILQDYQLSESFITITVVDKETDLPPTESTMEVDITVLSTVEGRTQITQATATIIPNDDEFDVDYSEYAVFAQDEITISDASTVKNWTASPSYTQNTVKIGTLATQPLAVQIDTVFSTSSLELHSYDYASSMLSSRNLRRFEFNDQLPFYDPPPAPSGGKAFELSAAGNEHDSSYGSWNDHFAPMFLNHSFGSNSTNTYISEGTYSVDVLSLNSRRSITIIGDVIISVDDDLILRNTTITLADDATLAIHVGGDLKIKSSRIGDESHSSNSWMDPSRVQLYGHGSNDWEISGISLVKAELYAPDCEIELRGASTLCGRVAGEEVNIRGTSRILYDQSLDHGGFAETDGMLYTENGGLRSELQLISELNPTLLDSIEQACFATIDSNAYSMANNSYFADWRDEPTDRLHDVIYEIVVHGTDARRWERLARVAHNTIDNSHSNGTNRNYSPPQFNDINQFDWDDLNWDDFENDMSDEYFNNLSMVNFQ